MRKNPHLRQLELQHSGNGLRTNADHSILEILSGVGVDSSLDLQTCLGTRPDLCQGLLQTVLD